MSKQRTSNQIPDVEVSGEWDHGMLDPILVEKDTSDANNLSFRDIKRSFLKVEGQVEGAVRTAFHKVEHAVEHAVEEMKLHDQESFGDELAEIVDVGVAMRIHGE